MSGSARPFFLLTWALCAAAWHVAAYKHYQERIPNGDVVPHPCKPNFLWEGVGHRNVDGGGSRNPFGLDFAQNGHKWDRCLCERDSDGDGITNGEELGDPDCVWTEGAIPTRTSSLSHPGVCEPLDSAACIGRNDWAFCEYGEFTCDAINSTDVQEVTLSFPTTPVPAKETSYFCMTFDLADHGVDISQDYHLIATRPTIDNKNVMHHIGVMGCTEDSVDLGPFNNEDWKMPVPTECGMAAVQCGRMIGLWTLGLDGECFPEEYGFRVGKNGFKTLLLQYHWNNPELESGYTDRTSMTLYLTPHLRANDAAKLQVGQLYLNIPPGQDDHKAVSHCHRQCTEHLPHPIYFSDVLLHMHYLGRSAALEHIRDGDVLELVSDPEYSYDNPKSYRFPAPIEFRPGDEMKFTCNFKSTTKTSTTYFGDATSDEMCFAFLTYYPARHDYTTCSSFASLDFCENEVGGDTVLSPMGHCNYTAFFDQTALGAMMGEVAAACAGPETCPDGCRQIIERVHSEQPCLQGEVGDFTEIEVIVRLLGDDGRNWLALWHSCDPDWDPSLVFRETQHTTPGPGATLSTSTRSTPRPEDGACVFDVGAATTLGTSVVIMASSLVLSIYMTAAVWQ